MRCFDDSFNRYFARRNDFVRECRVVQQVDPPDSQLLDEMFGPNPLILNWDPHGTPKSSPVTMDWMDRIRAPWMPG